VLAGAGTCLLLLAGAPAQAYPLVEPDEVVTGQGDDVTVRVLLNDSTDDFMAPLRVESVLLGPGVPGSDGYVTSGRRSLVLPGTGTFVVLAGGLVRFVPDPRFVGHVEPIRYSVQDAAGARAGAFLRIEVRRARIDPAVEPGIQAVIDGRIWREIGANAPRDNPWPPAAMTELPRTGPAGVPVAWAGGALLAVGLVLRAVPARRPVHR